MTDRVIRGSCLCGAVRFEVALPFQRFGYCYCSRCRKATGAGRAANAYVRPAQIAWLSGEELVSRWDLPSARSFATAVCARCGSPLPHATRSGREVVVPAGSFDDPLPVAPSERFEWESRAPWEHE
ncbi:MAG: GFA family protein [Myxococcota bacterium]